MTRDETPLVLALDASTDACTVAVGGESVLAARRAVIPREHARQLLPMVDAVLADAGVGRGDLGVVACGRGPGSFTGVRISLSVAQGIAMALALPVVGLSTLEVLAAGCHRRTGARRIAVALDARMDEVYWGTFEGDSVSGRLIGVGDAIVCAPEEVALPPEWNGFIGVGTGWDAHGERLGGALGRHPDALDTDHLLDAVDMIPLAVDACMRGRAMTPEALEPMYLRNTVTQRASG